MAELVPTGPGEFKVDMESLQSIKTEEDPFETDAVDHAMAEFVDTAPGEFMDSLQSIKTEEDPFATDAVDHAMADLVDTAPGEFMDSLQSIKTEEDPLKTDDVDHAMADLVDTAPGESTVEMDSLLSIKTEEHLFETAAVAHAVQQFIPDSQTSNDAHECIKAESMSDQEFIDEKQDSNSGPHNLALADDQPTGDTAADNEIQLGVLSADTQSKESQPHSEPAYDCELCASMYVWSENIASRGGEEIASCLLKYLEKNVHESIKHIILYSDSCGGQNRNIKVALLLKHFQASNNIDIIEQKFFLSGHSFNSCDRNFGYIEKERKKFANIYDPEHWINIIESTKKTEPKFCVTKMECKDFFSSQDLEVLICSNKEEISWRKTRTLTLLKDQIFELRFQYDDGQVHSVHIGKKNITPDQFRSTDPSLLYPFGRTITKQKKDDLLFLMKFVPAKYQPFYESLRTHNELLDYDYASGDSDE